MRTLYITLICIFLMAIIVPLHASLAVSPSSPLYTHFAYMFGHANFIHWGINGWCILMVHHQFRFHRLLAAWLCSVLLSFIYYPALPVLGASVLISFFMGFSAHWYYRYHRIYFWQMVLGMAIGFLLPYIAGIFHVVLFCLGFIYAKAERFIRHANTLNI